MTNQRLPAVFMDLLNGVKTVAALPALAADGH